MTPLSRIILTASALWLAISTAAATAAATNLTVNGQPFPSLIDVTIDDLISGLDSGLFTSLDLVDAYIARIKQVNDELRAVTEINPDARCIAGKLDAQRAAGAVKGPLHGVPVLIKDNIATADKMNNTAGSYALLGAKVGEDSFTAKKLREAGAIILGKANLSQWANFRSSNSSNGWAAYGGQVKAAYIPDQDPSGSSSGSGVAADLGLAWGTLGTETAGSIISPAQRNNLVGIKPTVGLTSRHLVIPISEHQDSVGPMTRTARDAALLLGVIAGPDPKDNYTQAIPFGEDIPDYVAACDAGTLRGVRLGVPRNVFPPQPDLELVAFEEAIELMRAEGAQIIEANFTNPQGSNVGSLVLEVDFVTNLAEYLAELTVNPRNVTDLEGVRAFTQSFGPEEFPDRNTAVWDAALERGFDNTDAEFWEALQANYAAGGEGGLIGAVRRNDLDAVVMPSSGGAGRAAIQGAPIITVPAGFYPANTTVETNARGLVTSGPNLPFGISFLGDFWTEDTLFKLACAYEKKTMARDEVRPYLVPDIEVGDVVGY